MNTVIELIATLAAFAIVARLLTFHRRAARYRPGVALAAWALVVIATCVAFYGPPPGEFVRPIFTAALVALAIALIRTGGNVAQLGRRPRRSS